MSQMGNTEIIRDPTQQQAQDTESPITKALGTIVNLFWPQTQQVINLLRTPTPLKITTSFVVSPGGLIGGGLSAPNPETIYECPMSAEGWLHRITVWCPEHLPANPLTQGQLLCTGSTAGETIFFLPNEYALSAPGGAGLVAPMQVVVEGRTSAPHLNAGERMLIVGDGLPAGIHIRFDLQLTLHTGLSQYTPKDASPGLVKNGHIT